MGRGQEIVDRMNATTSKNPAAVALGRLGGRVKSARKTEANRRNGKLGGRPRKVQPLTQPEAQVGT